MPQHAEYDPWCTDSGCCISAHTAGRVCGHCNKEEGCDTIEGAAAVPMDMTLQGKQELYAPYAENEGYDRTDLRLPGQQMELAKNLARRTDTPLVAILVHGGPVDVSWLQASPRIGAILTAWYPGQVGDLR